MSLIGDALDYLHETIHAPGIAGELITIRRSPTTCTTYAVIGVPPLPPQSMLGYEPGAVDMLQPSPVNTDKVFFVMASEYKPAGVVSKPVDGDEILRTVGGVTRTYEIMAPQSGGRAWELIDDDKQLKINAKFISEA